MTTRRHNFNAGPAALPLSVLEKVQHSIVDFDGHGLSLLEMSHRSPEFSAVIDGARAVLSDLYQIPNTHEVMFLQGGASLQFAMIPFNFGSGGAYVDTGTWSSRAIHESRLQGDTHVLWSGADGGYSHIPTMDEIGPIPDGASTFTTRVITPFTAPPADVPDESTLCDMSSDFISRPVDVSALI